MVFHACRIQFIENQASLRAQEFGNVSYTETVTVLPVLQNPVLQNLAKICAVRVP